MYPLQSKMTVMGFVFYMKIFELLIKIKYKHIYADIYIAYDAD